MVKALILGTIGIGIAYLVNYVYGTAAKDDIFFRLAVTVLAGLYAGLLFLVFVLPAISETIARLLYSNPSVAPDSDDPMHDARSLQAKGNYVGAMEALRHVVMDDPSNRLAWIDMAKTQSDHLEDSEGAVATIKEALKKNDWGVEDESFLLFYLADMQLNTMNDRAASVQILQGVCEKFPDSKHAASATHQLRELGVL